MRLPAAPLKLYCWKKEPIPSQQIMKAKIQTLVDGGLQYAGADHD
jgi:hypothetical protein